MHKTTLIDGILTALKKYTFQVVEKYYISAIFIDNEWSNNEERVCRTTCGKRS